MIDIEWLKTVHFETSSGRVTGLAGIGSQWIVFHCKSAGHSPELGEDIVIKIPNTPRLGFHIREIPPDLEIKPSYDPARVNRKLRAQVGNPLFDSMVEPYNDLYERILAILHRGGLEAIQSIAEDDEVETYLVYLLKTPGMRRRLEDIAFLDLSGDPREVVMCNGLVDVIEAPRGQLSTWARSMLTKLESIAVPEGSAPDRLCENPFWIWGGAVLDNFFTSEEMTDAVQFIAANFGHPAEGPDAPRLRIELLIFLTLLSLVAARDKIARLVEFCNHLGFRFSLPDPETDEVEKREKPAEVPAVGKMPILSPPSVARRFSEEGQVDPMAQDPRLLGTAAAILADYTTRLKSAAHAAGISVMLPYTDDESALHWKPWRSVVPVQNSATAKVRIDSGPPELVLTQRLLTCAQAVEARTGSKQSPEATAQLIEEIGYIAIGRSHDVRDTPKLNAVKSLGAIAARLHGSGYVHGDLQPDNFTFKPDGEIQSMFDLGRTCNPGRPLTLLERASDLAVLKRHVSFLEWEAAKLGYRSEAPDADEVLAQFEPR
jgi:hypothetical protein